MEPIATTVSKALAQATEQQTKARQPGTPMPEPYEKLWREQLSQFQTLGDPDLELMAQAATEFVAMVQFRQANPYGSHPEPYWLSLLGASGTGKTMLATMVMRFIRKNCLIFTLKYGLNLTEQAASFKWPETVRQLKQGQSDAIDFLCEKERKWDGERRCTCAFAMIDDIGQVEDSRKSYLLAALGQIADARLKEWTIWTSNLTLAQIAENVDPRVSSRMIRGSNVVVENRCIDWNLRV